METLLLHPWWNTQLVEALSWTLLHSLWQGGIMACVGAGVLSGTRRSPAALRYNLLTALLAGFILIVGYTFFKELSAFRPGTPAFTGAAAQNGAMILPHATSSFVVATRQPTWSEALTQLLTEKASYIATLWLVLLLLKALQLSFGLYAVQILRNKDVAPAADPWVQRFSALLRRAGVGGKVKLLESRHTEVPLTIGFFKPLILVPAGLLMQLPVEQAEAILLHELAHIRRNDYLVNLLQSAADVLFFFNPGLLWLSRRIRQEREASCDDMVLQHTAGKKTYLDALLYFERYPAPAAGLSLGFGARGQLLYRIRRMITGKNTTLNTMEKTFFAFGVILLATLTYAARPLPHAASRLRQQSPALVLTQDTVPLRDTAGAPSGAKQMATKAAAPTAVSDEEKPYVVKDGAAAVRSSNGWASAGELTDIIMVDGQRMTPEQVNRTIKRSEIRAVGAANPEAAQRIYGIEAPVLEIYIHSTPGNTAEDFNQSTVDDIYQHNLKATEQQIHHQNYIHHQQEVNEIISEVNLRKSEAEQARLLNEKQQYLADQQRILNDQRLQLLQEQRENVKEQQQITEVLKKEMLRDRLVKSGEHFNFSISSEGLYINSQKQPEAVFQKYKALLESFTHKPLEGQHWEVKE